MAGHFAARVARQGREKKRRYGTEEPDDQKHRRKIIGRELDARSPGHTGLQHDGGDADPARLRERLGDAGDAGRR